MRRDKALAAAAARAAQQRRQHARAAVRARVQRHQRHARGRSRLDLAHHAATGRAVGQRRQQAGRDEQHQRRAARHQRLHVSQLPAAARVVPRAHAQRRELVRERQRPVHALGRAARQEHGPRAVGRRGAAHGRQQQRRLVAGLHGCGRGRLRGGGLAGEEAAGDGGLGREALVRGGGGLRGRRRLRGPGRLLGLLRAAGTGAGRAPGGGLWERLGRVRRGRRRRGFLALARSGVRAGRCAVV